MRIRAVLSVVVLAWSATACTGGSEPAKPRATVSPREVVDKTVEPPLPFCARPLWTDRSKGVPRYADRFALHGDSVVMVSGPKGGEDDRLSVMDAATGRIRWSVGIWKPLRGGHGDRWDGLGPYDPVPQIVDRGGDWGVLVRTSQNHDSIQGAHGLALMSGKDGSVLWLYQSNDLACANLRREAAVRGIAADRLVFAPPLPLTDHLARLKRADLFLDTRPCNAHTTASDALWAGLPVVTCLGETFAGRVAASLLTAVGTPELVTSNLDSYAALALKLARDATSLRSIRSRLEQSRQRCPLFDTDRFRRHIEAAYLTMWDLHRRGEPPRSFGIDPIAA